MAKIRHYIKFTVNYPSNEADPNVQRSRERLFWLVLPLIIYLKYPDDESLDLPAAFFLFLLEQST
jgi:hypothetical protein